ncbi:TPA: hypothetical protein DDY56_03560 [Candidatus Uhrbacteria bacterium]|nr:hypothetical protein [Candidatus Uhrbacteria bacterium]HAN06739.1 hypothetical protein [Candidatus Uhrbacteria bacterium]HAP66194.1 hypothetical protein [Candidatus Uhrbacteria bacterium]HBA51634.1 hypothetical protein [Candidatus Uhrbacteria bacterium]HBC39821.1 hypothetical protein [Candidatus Uhrbacteria bacterium]
MIQKQLHMAELSQNKLDSKLFDRFCQLPVFSFSKLITPDPNNLEEQKQEFLRTHKNPVFLYSKAQEFDAVGYLKEIKECRADLELINSDDWIRDIYLAKLDELKARALFIKAMQDNNDEKVSELAKNIFGAQSDDQSKLEQELNDMLATNSKLHAHAKKINAEIFSKMVRAVLDAYGMQKWKIKLSEGSAMKLTRGRKSKSLAVHIPKNFSASRARAQRILVHEIEVHALRTHNAKQSPLEILQVGLDHYSQTEEGLALYYQQKIGTAKTPAFWESYACALSMDMSFSEMFNTLIYARTKVDKYVGHDKLDKEREEKIWNLCVRAYRGISNPNKPGLGTCKDHIYRTGLDLINQLDMNNKQTQKLLFAGNIGVQHLSKLNELNVNNVQTPMLISKQIAKQIYRENR